MYFIILNVNIITSVQDLKIYELGLFTLAYFYLPTVKQQKCK